MKTYLFTWESKGNMGIKPMKVVRAESLTDAQNQFWNWLKTKPIFEHLWHLEFQVHEVED